MDWDIRTLTSFGEKKPALWTHLDIMYLTWCSIMMSLAGGLYLHMLWNIGGYITIAVSMGLEALLLTAPPQRKVYRAFIGIVSPCLKGATFGAFILLFFKHDLRDTVLLLLASVFLGVAMTLGCFRVTAILVKQCGDIYLYLGGLISSAMCIVVCMYFASAIFGGIQAKYMLGACSGILLLSGYVLVYIHMKILEGARGNNIEDEKLAFTIFINFPTVLIRIIKVVLKKTPCKDEEEEEEEKKKKKRKRNKRIN